MPNPRRLWLILTLGAPAPGLAPTPTITIHRLDNNELVQRCTYAQR
jgi:hypothetical protein